MGARSFTDLIVWQKASALSNRIYALTGTYPREELYRLVDQMRRAAASIPLNIAEGFGRWTPKAQAHFYTIAKTSGDELKTQPRQSRDLGYAGDVIDILALTDEVCAMLYALRQRVLSRGSGR